ncbi:MAG: molybdate ABC transporter substrate-binding protein [Desulfovibrionaceae bacterium]
MRNRIAPLVLACLFLLSGVMPCALCPAHAADAVTVASGAGYKKLVMELAAAFTTRTGITVEQLYGNMGQTVAQARNSGLVDCVIGDRRFLDKSELAFDAMHEIGRGKLVLAFAKGVDLKSPADIAHAAITRVAMPDPKKAIYGRAADEYLRNTGLYDSVRDKLLVVGTVPQVSAYVLSREVDAGFINLTDALGMSDAVGGTLLVDGKDYAPISIVAGSLAAAPHADSLKRFAAFLSTPEAQGIARKHGL